MEPTMHVASPALVNLSQSVIYLMGLSFVLGSLFTILVLVMLEFMRRHRPIA